MIFVAAISRIIPHPYNFTPIGGMTLLGAAYFTKKYWAFIVPMAAMFLSDLFLNNVVYPHSYPQFYNHFILFGSPAVYESFILIALMGIVALKKVNVFRVGLSSLSASVLFFLITNFASWTSSASLYPQNFGGLMTCYAAGIPFFWNTLAGDLFYAAILFGAYAWAIKRYPVLAR